MVHNGIEYSMMQGYAEGFELMSKSTYNLDLAKIADLWMKGSVVRSWLLDLIAEQLKTAAIKNYLIEVDEPLRGQPPVRAPDRDRAGRADGP